jgi:hypothetical protein
MNYLFKLARRTASHRAVPLIVLAAAITACDTDRLTNSSDEPSSAPVPEIVAVPSVPSFSSTFQGGIPFGTFAQPTSAFGDIYNGAMRNIYPEVLRAELAAIKSRGGRVVLMFAGNERTYKDAQGHFSLSMWKSRVDRFKGVDISSFISDGTVIGHYLIDEPNDPFNWNGEPVSGATLEEMARYSKSLWPAMTTIVRTEPGHLAKWGGTYHHLDAAWAQYAQRKGDVAAFMARNVADAKSQGLGLIVGLNILMGTLNKTPLSASQIESWGSTMLADPYPCAFISWKYDERLVSRSDVKAAMSRLSQKAQAHASRNCGSGTATPPPTTLPGVSGIVLKVSSTIQDRIRYNVLTWVGAGGSNVKVYRNATFSKLIENDGRWRNHPATAGQYTYWVCETASTRCSNRVIVTMP